MVNKKDRSTIVIATRQSRLALYQANYVKDRLYEFGFRAELLGVTTQGDKVLDRSLNKIGGKGLFVKELEQALLDGRADIAVHSLKDLPMNLPFGLGLIATLEREDPRDVWVSNRFPDWSQLPKGSTIGTSSVRRQALLRVTRPDLKFKLLRGNLDTRLKKLDAGDYDGIVLAAAGLKRLGLVNRIASYFDFTELLPSPCQGILGIEARIDDAWIAESIAKLNDSSTWLIAHAERAVSRAMGGNCSMALAALAWLEVGFLQVQAKLFLDHPINHLRQELAGCVVKNVHDAECLGVRVAKALQQPK